MAKPTKPAPSRDEQLPEPVRMNFIIPADLHKRFKVGCANEGVSMTDVVVEFLEKRFPSPKSPK
jgi:hypothetical protein